MLPDRVLMKRIAGDQAVPWPEPLTFHGAVLLKDYRMNGFPRAASGHPWYDIPDSDYFSWLADYLPANLPALSAEQQHLVMQLDHAGRLSGIWLGDHAGWFESEAAMRPFHTFPADFCRTGDCNAVNTADGGYTYQEYLEWTTEVLDPGERVMTPAEYILDDYGWHLVLTENRRQFAACWPDFVKLDGVSLILHVNSFRDEPPDAGWRVYLAVLLRGQTDKASRIKVLEDFYYAWHDMMK